MWPFKTYYLGKMTFPILFPHLFLLYTLVSWPNGFCTTVIFFVYFCGLVQVVMTTTRYIVDNTITVPFSISLFSLMYL
jgi:hypothetical protein